MTPEREFDKDKLLTMVPAVYVALLTIIVAIWAIGGRNEIHYWPFLVGWLLAAVCFSASLALARTGMTMASAFLLIAAGTLTAPIGVPAVVIAWTFLARRHRKRFAYPVLAVVASVFCIHAMITFLPKTVITRPWRGPGGLLRGASLSWCWPSNLAALLKGTPYDGLRHRAVLCVGFKNRLERVSFAKLGFSRQQMRKANLILLKHVGPDLPRPSESDADAYIDATVYRHAYKQAQTEAVNYLIENQDSDNLRRHGLLPVLILDDAMTTERLLTLGAAIIAKAHFMWADGQREEGF